MGFLFFFSSNVWTQIASDIEMGVEMYQMFFGYQIYGW